MQMSVFGWTIVRMQIGMLGTLVHGTPRSTKPSSGQDGHAASGNKEDIRVLPRPSKQDSSVNDQLLVTEPLNGSLLDPDGWDASP